VTPLGESEPVRVDTLVIAATQESLQRAVEEKRFRADLCARLAGFTIVLPPLRDRSEDVPGLFRRMLVGYLDGPPTPVQVGLVERLCSYDWPFNVCEVEQLAGQLAALYGHEQILKYSHLPTSMRTEGARPSSPLPHAPLSPTNSLGVASGSTGDPVLVEIGGGRLA
jgi:two-component system, NtrC family, response regulator